MRSEPDSRARHRFVIEHGNKTYADCERFDNVLFLISAAVSKRSLVAYHKLIAVIPVRRPRASLKGDAKQ
jgi:hypothetical protein